MGLDPVAARDMRAVILGLKQAGKTIFLTSHYMFEVDALCDRVAVIHQGKILTEGTPASLKDLVADLEVVELECYGVPAELIAKLREHPRVESVEIEMRDQTQVLQIQAPAGAELIQEFLGILQGVQVRKVVTRQPTLEDAYIKLVGMEEGEGELMELRANLSIVWNSFTLQLKVQRISDLFLSTGVIQPVLFTIMTVGIYMYGQKPEFGLYAVMGTG